MDENWIPLSLLPVGASGKVKKINSGGRARRRMLDIGLTDGTEVAVLRKSPAGDPVAYKIRQAVIALRSEEASKVFVQSL